MEISISKAFGGEKKSKHSKKGGFFWRILNELLFGLLVKKAQKEISKKLKI